MTNRKTIFIPNFFVVFLTTTLRFKRAYLYFFISFVKLQISIQNECNPHTHTHSPRHKLTFFIPLQMQNYEEKRE
jgi:low temperature requirement protein LtrA